MEMLDTNARWFQLFRLIDNNIVNEQGQYLDV